MRISSRYVWQVLVACSVVAVAAPQAAAQVWSCPSVDSNAIAIRTYMRRIATGTHASSAAILTSLGVSSFDSSSVTLVTNDTTCTRVTQAVDSTVQAAVPHTGAMIVVAFGPFWAAFDPKLEHGTGDGPSVVFVLDSALALKRVITGN